MTPKELVDLSDEGLKTNAAAQVAYRHSDLGVQEDRLHNLLMLVRDAARSEEREKVRLLSIREAKTQAQKCHDPGCDEPAPPYCARHRGDWLSAPAPAEERKITPGPLVPCKRCDGSGYEGHGGLDQCCDCGGTGEVNLPPGFEEPPITDHAFETSCDETNDCWAECSQVCAYRESSSGTVCAAPPERHAKGKA